LASIRDAADELLAAIKAASPSAVRYLIDHPPPVASIRPWRLESLLAAIELFKRDNRRALRSLPKRDMMGRPHQISEQLFILNLRFAWDDAHAKEPPERGWPPFCCACIDPLPKRFGRLGPRARDDRARRNLLAEAIRSYEAANKSPI
jgi:hypothetical protein